MVKLFYLVASLILCVSHSGFAQSSDGFEFHRPNKRSYKIKFKSYNNLIIIEVKLNGQLMNFLLDTGVDKTVLFGLKDVNDDIKNRSEKILIKGVSGKQKTFAYKIINNVLEIGKLKDHSHDVYAIFDKNFNISNKIGYQIQGIIGHDFFKDLVVKINYTHEYLKIYNPKYFNKRLRAYQALDLRLHLEKPYIQTPIKQNDKWEDYVFLLDTGSGDAIWIIQDKDVAIPDDYFYDILGYGIADIIKGRRSKAKALKLGDNIMQKPKIAFPDTASYKGVNFTKQSGVLGAEIMRRFNWVFDYKSAKVYIKPNDDFYDDFNYDMSGLIFKYLGFQSITRYEIVFPQTNQKNNYNSRTDFKKAEQQVVLEYRPILKVGAVRYNSSAYEAGFIENDEILEIDGQESYKLNIEEITALLSSREGREINFTIRRNGIVYKKSLILKSRFHE